MSWFVIITTSGQEENLKTYLSESLHLDAIYPRMERFFRVRKQDVYAIRSLVVGCVLVKTQYDKNTLTYILNQQSNYLVEKVAPVAIEEISKLLGLMNDRNVIEMSKGVSVNHRTMVFEGPLKGNENLIIKHNAHKRLAELDIRILGNTVLTGLEIVEKR